MTRRIAARWLETGRFTSAPARALSALYGACAHPARPVPLPRGAAVIGVAGATLGGSGATPAVYALAGALRARGIAVAVAGHGYRATVAAPHRVAPTDAVEAVGDEALWLARGLGDGVPVWVSASRRAVLRTAAASSRIVVADGLLQASPERVALSVLVLDGARPFGAARCPPAGDLRAPEEKLLAAADDLLLVARPGVGVDGAALSLRARSGLRPWVAAGRLTGARSVEGRALTLPELRALRVGVVAGIARPERLLESLAAEGIRPCATRLLEDHAPPARFSGGERFLPHAAIDLWLTTRKCATKVGRAIGGAPVFVLDHDLELPSGLVDRVAAIGGFSHRATVLRSPPCSESSKQYGSVF